MMYSKLIKRLFDIFFSIIISILFLPLVLILLIVSSIIFSKPIYTQIRIGRNLKEFKIYKITSLYGEGKNVEEIENKNKDNFYGNLIRNFGLDELLQVYNIFKGDMSFIGPRPLSPDYLNFYNNAQLLRHRIRPGITGLAQINKNNIITYKESFQYDLYYVKNISLLLDLYIFFFTFRSIYSNFNNKIKIKPPFNGKN